MIKLKYPGLTRENLPTGEIRHRVRVQGDANRKITLLAGPDHKEFSELYHAARRGIQLKTTTPAEERATRGSLAWLTYLYLDHIEKQVEAGLKSQYTLVQQRSFLIRLRTAYPDYVMEMPKSQVIKIRDGMMKTPGAADNMVKTIRTMYNWGIETGHCTDNPAIGVAKINKNSKGGAKPWTVDDLKTFRATHQAGTTAHLYLTLLMFTACRISDATWLGRQQEFDHEGQKWLGWQPKKKNSPYVEVPMLPPLLKATRAAKILGMSYILTEHGQSFRSEKALGNRMRKWCEQAGLHHLSSHGVRKAAGELLVHEGCTTYEVMAILGHSESKTSEVYTKGAERRRLAMSALSKLEGMKW
ncbi:site-specific integrase [Cohaesibacter celericrescens]|uniref:Integrase n=1 Tax=Cohaesibacter celericrescens TaxID=2067669 RepID=A0A2N5XXD5_9HYPH|nr:tyrosine-type recombinase/integrase [Cohaesibacter celericrescens]PLW79105.1 integrase [Cohaesibacter celericrescens]